MSQVVVFFVGCVFVVAGRWLYTHPDCLAGAKSKSSTDLARFLGIMFVFVGSANVGFFFFGAILGGIGEVVLTLGCATVFTWFTFRQVKAEREAR